MRGAVMAGASAPLAPLNLRPAPNPAALEARWRAWPKPVRVKQAHVEDVAAARFAESSSLYDRATAALEDLRAAERELARYEANRQPERVEIVTAYSPTTGESTTAAVRYGGGEKPHLAQRVERLKHERERLVEVHKVTAARAAEARRLATACSEWIDATDPATVRLIAVPREQVDDVRAALAAVRTRLVALDAERQAITAARVPQAEALARVEALRRAAMERVAARMADRARAFYSPLGVRDVDAILPLPDVHGTARFTVEAVRELVDVLLCDDTLGARLVEAVKAQAPDGAIPSAERPRRLKKLAAKRRDLEVREERLIMSAEAAGFGDVERRGDADPSVVLLVTFAADAAA